MVAPGRETDPMVTEAMALYASRLRARLEPQENGKFLVLNLDTGEYEVDADSLAASRRARARFGDARLIKLRVGYPAAYDLGASGATSP